MIVLKLYRKILLFFVVVYNNNNNKITINQNIYECENKNWKIAKGN